MFPSLQRLWTRYHLFLTGILMHGQAMRWYWSALPLLSTLFAFISLAWLVFTAVSNAHTWFLLACRKFTSIKFYKRFKGGTIPFQGWLESDSQGFTNSFLQGRCSLSDYVKAALGDRELNHSRDHLILSFLAFPFVKNWMLRSLLHVHVTEISNEARASQGTLCTAACVSWTGLATRSVIHALWGAC